MARPDEQSPAPTPVETVYTPDLRVREGIAHGMVRAVRNVVRGRDLVWQLFRRDFLAAYRKSFLGLTWLALSPLLAILSWVVMNRAGVLQPGDTELPYPAYVLLGMTLWGLFMGGFTGVSGTLTVAQSFIMKVNTPHEVLLAKQILEQAVSFLIGYTANVVVLLLLGVRLHLVGVLLAPLVAVPLLLAGAAVGLVVAVIGAMALEVRRLAETALGLMLFATPVLFTVGGRGPLLDACIRWNPLSHLIVAARACVVSPAGVPSLPYALSLAGVIVAFLIAWRLFSVSEALIVERLG